MKVKRIVYFSLILVILLSTYIYAYIPKPSPIRIKTDCHNPTEVTKLFLESVNKGELKIFNKKIESSMLIPIRVSYVYELNNASSKLKVYKVYSKLSKPMNIPNLPKSEIPKISGINVEMDQTGKIIKTEVHIWHNK